MSPILASFAFESNVLLFRSCEVLFIVFSYEETCIKTFLKRTPVATDATIVSYDRLEDAGVVMSEVLESWVKNNVTTLVADKILIVGRYQEVFSLAETSRSAILMKKECLSLAIKVITYKFYTTLAVAYIQS